MDERGKRTGEGVAALRPREFAELSRLVERESNIRLGPTKMPMVGSRLKGRLRGLGLRDYGTYLSIVRTDAEERQRMLESLSTHETRFFREPAHFRFLEKVVYPVWKTERSAGQRGSRVRAWSTACSTGEEPYSLAMSLLTHLPKADGWTFEILATDLCRESIARARAATWPILRAEEIPATARKAFMLRGVGPAAGWMRAAEHLRSIVRFAPLNLAAPAYPVQSGFDLIFCRNVLMYFAPDARRATAERLLRHLHPRGYLFVGHAETLSSLTREVRLVEPTIYTSAGSPAW